MRSLNVELQVSNAQFEGLGHMMSGVVIALPNSHDALSHPVTYLGEPYS
jgi:hypothetical protein